jgi:hypothetical protein
VNAPGSAREALIAEAIGDLGRLLEQAQALQLAMTESRRSLVDAHAQLAAQLAAFEAQITAMTEKAKVQVVKHIVARTDEATRRSIERQGQAMTDAARAAFGAELGTALQRLQTALQLLTERPEHRWERWLTHAAAVSAVSAVTWALAVSLWAR